MGGYSDSGIDINWVIGYDNALFFHNDSQSGKEADMDFLNDFFHKIDRARGVYKTLEVITDYLWPFLIVLGIVIVILIVRSYLHGKRIKNLEKRIVGNLGQGGASNTFHDCHDIKILQATPDVARLLVNGQQPQLLQASADKIICPQCHRENLVHKNFCSCGCQIATDEKMIAEGLGHKTQAARDRQKRLEEQRRKIKSEYRQGPAREIICPRCHFVNDADANFCSCGYQIVTDEVLVAIGLGHRRQSDSNKSAPKPHPSFNRKPGSNKVR